jgi:hypothetical protein
VIDLKTPRRGREATVRRPAAGVLVLALDDAGLQEALPVAAARAAASGSSVTVAGTATSPWWWYVGAAGWLIVPHTAVGHVQADALAQLRERVARVAPDREICVSCHLGPVEAWLTRELRRNRYEAVLVGAGRIGARRARRLAAIAGTDRTFAVLSPL